MYSSKSSGTISIYSLRSRCWARVGDGEMLILVNVYFVTRILISLVSVVVLFKLIVRGRRKACSFDKLTHRQLVLRRGLLLIIYVILSRFVVLVSHRLISFLLGLVNSMTELT